ncbi:MAG: dihydroorotate dehydrogenase-like protein [Polyangiaceae bacterium]
MDLSTHWMGLPMASPLVVGAGPLCDNLEALELCVRGGAGAVVMRSLFEEQVTAEHRALHRWFESPETGGEDHFVPLTEVLEAGTAPYLRQLARLRSALGVPVIASLNGTTPGGWLDMARALEDGGASALELNLYEVPTLVASAGTDIEARQLAVVESVTSAVHVPVAVKISPCYRSLPASAAALARAGAASVVLFNRFYQPDVDLESLDVSSQVRLSTSGELPMRLHALAILSGRCSLELVATGGVHTGDDVVKAVLCGAHAVQVVSALLRHGPHRLAALRDELAARLRQLGYPCIAEARGVLSLERRAEPGGVGARAVHAAARWVAGTTERRCPSGAAAARVDVTSSTRRRPAPAGAGRRGTATAWNGVVRAARRPTGGTNGG